MRWGCAPDSRGGQVKFVHVKGHSGQRWNDHADMLANRGQTGELTQHNAHTHTVDWFRDVGPKSRASHIGFQLLNVVSMVRLIPVKHVYNGVRGPPCVLILARTDSTPPIYNS
eukprot:1183807-Prorocentrum_minimum.AAC.1